MNVSWVRSSASARSRTMWRMYRAIAGRYCSGSPVGGGVQGAMFNNLSQSLIGVCDQACFTEALPTNFCPAAVTFERQVHHSCRCRTHKAKLSRVLDLARHGFAVDYSKSKSREVVGCAYS